MDGTPFNTYILEDIGFKLIKKQSYNYSDCKEIDFNKLDADGNKQDIH